MENRRKILTLEVMPLVLTAIIAVATCVSSYYAYKTAMIVSGQESREKRKEIIEWIKLLSEFTEKVEKIEKSNELSQ